MNWHQYDIVSDVHQPAPMAMVSTADTLTPHTRPFIRCTLRLCIINARTSTTSETRSSDVHRCAIIMRPDSAHDRCFGVIISAADPQRNRNATL